MDFWNFWLDNRAWGLGRPLLYSLPVSYLTWEAISVRTGSLGLILSLVGLWIVVVLEWVKWRRGRPK